MPASLGGINTSKHTTTIVLSVTIVGLSLMLVLPDCNPLTLFNASSSSQEGMFDDMDSVCVINLVDDGTITASGTGFLYSTEGIHYVVTNKHVISIEYDSITAIFGGVGYKVHRYGSESAHDIAVLLFDDPWNLPSAVPLSLGTSDQRCALTLIGNIDGTGVLSMRPVDIASASTSIYVSGIPRPETFVTFGQALVPGESGGPVIDSVGKVIGMATMNYTDDGVKVGCAITSGTIEEALKEIIRHES